MQKQRIASFVAGLIFAVGLGVSGMTQPHKVVGFLDVIGDWDPSLVFVMLGAIGFNAVALRLITRRDKPLLNAEFFIPSRRDLTPRLVIGSAMFGVGWGMAGYCPGPALVTSSTGATQALIFVAAMIVGIQGERLFEALRARAKASQEAVSM
ncbi:MAG: YeeE/YedE family protein [Myxococcales bacterium]|nr:YeeE/YedE family protein [Myxococcales bacterium]